MKSSRIDSGKREEGSGKRGDGVQGTREPQTSNSRNPRNPDYSVSRVTPPSVRFTLRNSDDVEHTIRDQEAADDVARRAHDCDEAEQGRHSIVRRAGRDERA